VATTTTYDKVETAIKTTLDAEDSPFKAVEAYFVCLSDAQIAQRLSEMESQAPAAMVYYGGGTGNAGTFGVLEENAVYTVLVVAAATTVAEAVKGGAARNGVYQLKKYVIDQLHDKLVSGINNPLLYQCARRFQIPGQTLTVAALAIEFSTTLQLQGS